MIILPKNTIATHTVPNTDVTITIVHEPASTDALTLRYFPGRLIDRWTVTREPGTARFVNYLSRGCVTHAEANETANSLWSDTVTRRDAAAEAAQERFADQG